MQKELSALGADIDSGEDYLAVHGQPQFLSDGSKNPAFALHGGTVESYGDHRVAMSLACISLALPEGQTLTIKDSECCAVSFPHFYDVMKKCGANFTQS